MKLLARRLRHTDSDRGIRDSISVSVYHLARQDCLSVQADGHVKT